MNARERLLWEIRDVRTTEEKNALVDAFAHELAEQIRVEAMKYPTLRGGAYMRQAADLIDLEAQR
jgi:hypothetical protein